MEPTILYEDKDVLAVNKPAGLVVHGDGRSISLTTGRGASLATGKTKEKTLTDWVLSKYPEIKNVGESARSVTGETILRPGVVHRLDRETSGVMIIAKTKESFESLKDQFKNHEIKKIYHAFVFGEMKNDTGKIDRPIGRSKKDFRQWSAQRGARGEMREALTEYKVLKRGKGFTFVEVMPKTGRTHQIRVHFKAISYPLVGDTLYAPGRENVLGLDRLALHSFQLTWKDRKNKSITIKAPYPEDFDTALKILNTLA